MGGVLLPIHSGAMLQALTQQRTHLTTHPQPYIQPVQEAFL